MNRFTSLAAAFLLFLISPLTQAIPIQWTLNGVTFTDGTTASGSFTFDASTSSFSDLLISTAGFIYTTDELSPFPFGVGPLGIELVDGFVPNNNVGKSILNLDFVSLLTNAGGLINLVRGFPSFEGRCSSADCGSGLIFRQVTAGNLVGIAVPEPGILVLLLIGLGGLAWVRRLNPGTSARR